MTQHFDIAIVGAGMAGASLAAALQGRARVAVLEAEDRPGYHTTGRSAAFWTESYGGPGVQPLTTASGPMLRALGMLSPRAALTLGRADQADEVAAFAREYAALGVEVISLDRAGIAARVQGLRPGWTCGVIEPSCCDIDVAGLHQHYLAQARRQGAEIFCRAALAGAARTDRGWTLALGDGRRIGCDLLVNAAGAWADPVAGMAGLRPIGVTPYRRTIAQLSVSPPVPADLPLVLDIAGQFYFKPESGRLWLSPHDETPSPPCDAAAEEIDIAIAIDRFAQVVDWTIERVEHRWAGLRSFAPDRLPVYGFDPAEPRFFWFAGQGGFGIQTAPAAAELAARLLLGEHGGPIDPVPYAPGRFS
ncbi:NAD(P)/FAD-dependent oxidoreductase [Novosphingobium album (ex Liu et al. 2023)]|uniref:FAD-dependent oxidoreductase n=1 Tax=Novosphingobium album (ex Liu et al. 2023) TaxID=3031130 RepID=A0ABT5WRI0_9SPHN|nr:FAD-dependent oxidoreductase [Novosphingobium album (ex Liu et al. 2023)]MDE8652605.1 FAD-dependent oxidoreductase [Novosphingobium album (ex Liu et al. 2023)]